MNNIQLNVALESTVTVKIQRGNNVQPKALLLLRGMNDKYIIFHLPRDSENSGWDVNEHDFSVFSTGKFPEKVELLKS